MDLPILEIEKKVTSVEKIIKGKMPLKFDMFKWPLIRSLAYLIIYNYILIPNNFFFGMLILSLIWEGLIILLNYYQYYAV